METIGFMALDETALDQVNGGCCKTKKVCPGTSDTTGGGDSLLGPGETGGTGTPGGKTCIKKTCERERECEREHEERHCR